MSSKSGQNRRVVSGMRPTGQLHLGNYHGALANWVELQYEYECFFFVADWHALTTGYENTVDLKANTNEVLIDWLAAGLNPSACTIFVQSRIPEHAELHLILSMVTPISWLGWIFSERWVAQSWCRASANIIGWPDTCPVTPTR